MVNSPAWASLAPFAKHNFITSLPLAHLQKIDVLAQLVGYLAGEGALGLQASYLVELDAQRVLVSNFLCEQIL